MCGVCEVCMERLHKKHELRREINKLALRLKIEYRPELAKNVRSKRNELLKQYYGLE